MPHVIDYGYKLDRSAGPTFGHRGVATEFKWLVRSGPNISTFRNKGRHTKLARFPKAHYVQVCCVLSIVSRSLPGCLKFQRARHRGARTACADSSYKLTFDLVPRSRHYAPGTQRRLDPPRLAFRRKRTPLCKFSSVPVSRFLSSLRIGVHTGTPAPPLDSQDWSSVPFRITTVTKMSCISSIFSVTYRLGQISKIAHRSNNAAGWREPTKRMCGY